MTDTPKTLMEPSKFRRSEETLSFLGKTEWTVGEFGRAETHRKGKKHTMKNPLTPIQSLERQLRKRFQEARISLDEPSKKDGRWFLDIENDDHFVVVQWKESFGFGISCSPMHSYGEGADEVYQDFEAAYSRIACLRISRTQA